MTCDSWCTGDAESDWKSVNLYVFMSVSGYFFSFLQSASLFINSLYSSPPLKEQTDKKSTQHLIAFAEKEASVFQCVRYPLSLAWQRLSLRKGCHDVPAELWLWRDFKGFSGPSLLFSPMPSSPTKEAAAPLRLSCLVLYFGKLHLLLFLLNLHLFQKHSYLTLSRLDVSTAFSLQ